MVWESLFRLQWRQFEKYVDEHGDLPLELPELDDSLDSLRICPDKETFATLLALEEFNLLMDLHQGFCQQRHSPLFKFWSSYLSMVDILLPFVCSIREGNWVLHCVCLRQMHQYMFAYDRINYAWYMPIYWCEMTVLERTHPEAYQRLMSGDFAVQRSPANAFAQVAIDQTIEQTINRDCKVKVA